ncbi:MAG: serine hydrolase [Luteolibacter sp.]
MKTFRFLKTLAILLCLLPAGLRAQAPESVMVIEAYSGKILVSQNANVKRPVASLIKVATAVVAVDWAAATGREISSVTLSVPPVVQSIGGPNPMNLQPGDTLTLMDAIRSTVLGSDNYAALAIAHHIGSEIQRRRGSRGDPVMVFVGEMNHLAEALGMTSTRFTNPLGLDLSKNAGHSTAADIARLSVYAMRKNAINFMVSQKQQAVRVNGGQRRYTVKNGNDLTGVMGVNGLKAGNSGAAGPCLAVSVHREPLVRKKADGSKGVTPRRLIVVVLNNPDRYGRAQGLIQQGWSMYDSWLASGAPVQDRKREILSVRIPE